MCRGAASFGRGTGYEGIISKKDDVLWEAQTVKNLVLDARI